MIDLLPLAASAVSILFALFIGQQFVRRRRPQELAWAIALLLFSLASLAAGKGIISGWNPFLFRSYYLFGAIANVPVLALGTIYLLISRKLAHAFAVGIAVALIYATGAVFSADLNNAALQVTRSIPAGHSVVPGAVRVLSRWFSFAGFFVVLSGALWSAWRLSQQPGERFRRLTQGNVLIAIGTAVVAMASVFARHGGGEIFSVGLLAGVSIMFAGFLKTRSVEPIQPGEVGLPNSP